MSMRIRRDKNDTICMATETTINKKTNVKIEANMKRKNMLRPKMSARFTAVISLLIFICVFLTLPGCSFIILNEDKIPYLKDKISDTSADTETDDTGDTDSTTTTENGNDKTDDMEKNIIKYEYDGEAIADKYLETAVKYNFGGNTVIVAVTAASRMNIESGGEEDTASYSYALYKRNLKVEEKLNCKLRYFESDEETLYNELSDAVKSGLYYADLLATPQHITARLAVDGYLFNLRSLPFIDLTKEYFDAAAISQLTGGHYIYALAGDAVRSPEDFACVYFNSNIVKASNYSGNLYALAKSGGWDWDTLLKIALASERLVSLDERYAGTIDDEARYEFAYLLSGSSGNHFVVNTVDTVPQASLPQSASGLAELCYSIFYESNFNFAYGSTDTEEKADENISLRNLTDFISGKSVFHIGTLADLESLSECNVNWGVLPIPKYDVKQEGYYTAMPKDAFLAAVPAKTTNPDGLAALLDTLFAASAGYLRDVFVEYQLYNTVRDNSSLDMIDIIWQSAYYDFTYIFGIESRPIRNIGYNLISDAATAAGTREEAAANIEKLYARRSKDADKTLSNNFGIR